MVACVCTMYCFHLFLGQVSLDSIVHKYRASINCVQVYVINSLLFCILAVAGVRFLTSVICHWLDLYWRRIIRPDGSSVEKDHPSSLNTGRTMRRTIGVSCDSSRVL